VCGARTQWTQKCVGPLATKLKGSKSRGEGHTAHTQPQTKCSRDTRHYTYYDSWNDPIVTMGVSRDARFSLEVDGFLSHVCHLCVGAHLSNLRFPQRNGLTVLSLYIRSHLNAQSSYPALRAERVTCTWPHALTRPSHNCISVRIAHCPDRICPVLYPQGSSLDPPSRRTTSSRS
jgi:hypothetical protein